MSAAVSNLLQEALLLPPDSRMELIEALLERSEPSRDFIDAQMDVVQQRMENVKRGHSNLVPAEEAHAQVLNSLNRRA